MSHSENYSTSQEEFYSLGNDDDNDFLNDDPASEDDDASNNDVPTNNVLASGDNASIHNVVVDDVSIHINLFLVVNLADFF